MWNKQNIQNTSKPSLLTLPLIKYNSHLFFKRDFSSWVHMPMILKYQKQLLFSTTSSVRTLEAIKGLFWAERYANTPAAFDHTRGTRMEAMDNSCTPRAADSEAVTDSQVLLNNHINYTKSNLQVTGWMPSLLKYSFLSTRRIQYPGSTHFVTEYLHCWQGSRHTMTSWSLQTVSAQVCQRCNPQKSPTLWQNFTRQL